LDEVGDRCLPVYSEDLFVDVFETAFVGDLFQVADGAGVVDEFDETAVAAVRDYGVGLYPDFDVLFLKDLVYEGDQLHRHVLLPQIIT
jgi:hypothetical protein